MKIISDVLILQNELKCCVFSCCASYQSIDIPVIRLGGDAVFSVLKWNFYMRWVHLFYTTVCLSSKATVLLIFVIVYVWSCTLPSYEMCLFR